MAFARTPSPARTEDRSIANYKNRNHYFSGEDALSLSHSLLAVCTHQIKNIIVCCSFCRLYIFFYLLFATIAATPATSTVAQVHKVFEWWLFCEMMKAIHEACTHIKHTYNTGVKWRERSFWNTKWTNIINGRTHQPMCLHTWIFIFVTQAHAHSKQLGRTRMLFSFSSFSFHLSHSPFLSPFLYFIRHLFFTTFCPIRMAKNHLPPLQNSKTNASNKANLYKYIKVYFFLSWEFHKNES